MNTKTISTMLVALALGAFPAMATTTQHEGHSGKKEMSHDHMMMAKDTHHILAMIHHQSLTAFAKALHEQTMHVPSVNVDFARASVAEMRHCFDQMKQHHQEHMKAMNPKMHDKMSGMMQKMEQHQTDLNTQLTALEQEVKLATPDAKKVSTLAASMHKHCQGMSKMHHGCCEAGTKMKM